ncbi:RidA family protein [Kordiimonas pumila]|uniref:RidA family protein n=1 Tax=Kordiimonas pumila TaxID=2161677 RepID=A0ABV7D405_9PROT|nr:RidA family protein [Kordiimonas pumila]
MTKKIIGAPIMLPGGGTAPYSKAAEAGGLVFLTGQLGLGPDGKLAEGGIEAQTEAAIANIKAILAEAGCTLDDVVKTTVWLTDAANFAGYNKVYAQHFSASPPPRSTVVADFVLPGALVEIEVIAAARA